LVSAIRNKVNEIGCSQTVAAQNLGLTQPWLSDLYRGNILKLALDAPVDIASKLGIQVRVEADNGFALGAGSNRG
jgi:predicted XRE-type DNA-binding protein